MLPSKGFQMVKLAYRKGYRVLPEGCVQSAHGRIRRTRINPAFRRVPYQTFTIKQSGVSQAYTIPVHQLAAFQKFGEEAYLAAGNVRHLNGNSLDNRPANIALGSIHENIMDRPAEARQKHAILAAAARSRADWGLIDADRAVGLSYRQLQVKYGVARGSLAYRYSHVAQRRRLINRSP